MEYSLDDIKLAMSNAASAGDSAAVKKLEAYYKEVESASKDRSIEDIDAALAEADKANDFAAVSQLKDYRREVASKLAAAEPGTDTALRMGINAVSSLPEAFVDLPVAAANWMFDKTPPIELPVAALKKKVFNAVGVSPYSSGVVEDVAQFGIDALSGAMGAKALSKIPGAIGKAANWLSQTPFLQMTGGFGAGVGKEIASASGAPEWTGTLAGGFAAPAAVKSIGGVGKIAANAAKSITPSGRDDVAARIFYKSLINPANAEQRLEDFAKNAINGGAFFPGSIPITAEIASDPGLSSMIAGFRGNPNAIRMGYDQINNLRISESDAAIANALNNANRRTNIKAIDVLDRLDEITKQAKENFVAGKDLYSTPVDTSPVLKEIERLKNRYKNQGGIEAFLNDTEKTVRESTNFQHLWNARINVDDAVYGAVHNRESPLRAEAKHSYDVVGKEVRTAINNSLKKSLPDFEKYLRQSSFALNRGDAYRTGRALQDKLSSTGYHAAEGVGEATGAPVISASKAQNVAKTLTDLAGNDSRVAEKLTPWQRGALDKSLREIDRRSNLNLGRQQGSPTADVLSKGSLLGRDIVSGILGDTGSYKGLLRYGMEFLPDMANTNLLRIPEQDILRRIAEGYTDPSIGLKMIQRGKTLQRGPMDFSGATKDIAKTGLLSIIRGGN